MDGLAKGIITADTEGAEPTDTMPYQSVWWYPNYVEYGSGLNAPKTWPTVMEQYRRPDPIKDLRHYDLPTEESEDALYFRYPRLLKPKYRGLFRDKPHCVQRFYPEGMELPDPGKPRGFHGRMYYEDGLPQFKYQGAKVNDLYYLEMPPYVPKTYRNAKSFDTSRGLNSPAPGDTRYNHQVHLRTPQGTLGRTSETAYTSTTPKVNQLLTAKFSSTPNQATKKITQDGVGYL